jgi:hypothetical protein
VWASSKEARADVGALHFMYYNFVRVLASARMILVIRRNWQALGIVALIGAKETREAESSWLVC